MAWITKYATALFFSCGLILVLIGITFFTSDSEWNRIFVSIGTTIIGGGFFSAITRTKQYTDFFQQRIFNVFFEPSKYIKRDDLKEKWMTLTKNLLKMNTNSFDDKAAAEIYERFLDLDSDYHYSNVEVSFDIELTGNFANVTQRIMTTVIANQDLNEINIDQSFDYQGDPERDDEYVTLQEVLVNNQKQEEPACKKNGAEEKYKTEWMIPINTSVIKEHKLERCFKYRQNILNDPTITHRYSRFVKGLQVKYKAKNCNVLYVPIGSAHKNKSGGLIMDEPYVDTQGYTRRQVSKLNELTLPWQGFMLIITHQDMEVKNENGCLCPLSK